MTGLSRGISAALLGSTAMFAACQGTNKTAAGDVNAGGRHEAGSLEGVSPDSAAGATAFSKMQGALDTDMRTMTGASVDQLPAMMPQHRQLVTTMIARMDQQMQSAHMTLPSAWLATRDSVNQDLMRMPSMSARDVQSMLPGHRARVNRLMQMSRGSMGGMGRMMPNR